MLRKLLALGVVGLLLAGGGLAFAAGLGPAPGGSGGSTPAFPTATPTGTADDGGPGGTEGAATATPAGQPFAVTIRSVEDCGRTCRDVTVSLTNRQSTDATGVTVYTRVFAGNSTDASDEVWRGSEDVGTLAAGDGYTATKLVELSYAEAYEVERAGGWVTVQTTVETDDRTVTFSERRNVA